MYFDKSRSGSAEAENEPLSLSDCNESCSVDSQYLNFESPNQKLGVHLFMQARLFGKIRYAKSPDMRLRTSMVFWSSIQLLTG